MATAQGICKNCGSLILLNDKEETCECLFCDCVFPTAEALEIAKDPEAYTFPNEVQPKIEHKRHQIAPVFLDASASSIKKAEGKKEEISYKKSPYEVSPDDVKAPKKVMLLISGIACALLVVVVAISLPLYLARVSNKADLASRMNEVFTDFKVDTAEVDGYIVGFQLRSQTNKELIASTNEIVTESSVLETFKRYAILRANQYGYNADDFSAVYKGVKVIIYAQNGGFEIQADKEGDLVESAVKKIAAL